MPARVSFELHQRFLRSFVKPGMRVLEIGAGRFTLEMVRLEAAVHVGDISPVQLELNARHVAGPGTVEGGRHLMFAARRPG